MADQEPESQIVPLGVGCDFTVPSSPPIPASMLPPNVENGNSRPHIGDEEPESQLHDRQPESYEFFLIEDTQFEPVEKDTQLPESCTSQVEETQFVSIEGDTQAVDEINFPLAQQDSQFREAYTLKPSPNKTIQPPSVISRPNLGGLDDLMAGFTYSKADKPEKGKFNRPPLLVPTKPQQRAEMPPDEDQPTGKFYLQML